MEVGLEVMEYVCGLEGWLGLAGGWGGDGREGRKGEGEDYLGVRY